MKALNEMLNKVMAVLEQPWQNDYHNMMHVLPVKLSQIGVKQSIIFVLIYIYFHNCRRTDGHRDDYDKFKNQVAGALKMQ